MSKKIMFNDTYALTQAVLDGTKTMTRRIEKPSGMADGYTMEDVVAIFHEYSSLLNAHCFSLHDNEKQIGVLNPRYKVGEVVAVAQSYKEIGVYDVVGVKDYGQNLYAPIYAEHSAGWNNKLFVKADLLPHHIRITDVRMERLQAISDDDIRKEGIRYYTPADGECAESGYGFLTSDGGLYLFDTPRGAYAALIDKISGKGTWSSNPFVVCYTFELIK